MTPSELKYNVEQGTDSFFFTRDSMKFFGDTMANYGVRSKPVKIDTYTRKNLLCWELYRRNPVRQGLSDSAFFDVKTFNRILPTKG